MVVLCLRASASAMREIVVRLPLGTRLRVDFLWSGNHDPALPKRLRIFGGIDFTCGKP
jgi:hypothetical protein